MNNELATRLLAYLVEAKGLRQVCNMLADIVEENAEGGVLLEPPSERIESDCCIYVARNLRADLF